MSDRNRKLLAELSERIHYLEQRVSDLENNDDNFDKKYPDWLWDITKVKVARDALEDAFNWDYCPYENGEIWMNVFGALDKIYKEYGG